MAIDWGDVATWFTGIVTAGSLWIAFLILRSDRKKEESAQARLVAAWTTTNLSESGEFTLELAIWNRSSLPIFQVAAFQKDDLLQVGEMFIIRGKGRVFQLLPEQRAGLSWRLRSDEEFLSVQRSAYVRFSDLDGRQWRLGLLDRRLTLLATRRQRLPRRRRNLVPIQNANGSSTDERSA